MVKVYAVSLSEANRLLLQQTVSRGTASARTITRARILLKADEGDDGLACTDTVIADALQVSIRTIERTRERAVTEGVEAALHARPPSATTPKKLDGAQEARLTALACGQPPSGKKRWSLRLLARTFNGQQSEAAVSHELVRRTLKKNILKPHLKEQWCIPPTEDAHFAWRMEDILDLSAQPYDPRRPVVCFDEMPKQLLADLTPPLPVRPGTVAREDYDYERRGVKNLFLWCEPLQGKRHVEVTDRRTMRDWAHAIGDLVDVHYPDAEVIRLVVDNLNTHTPASLYLAFEPAEARRLTSKVEIHYTPKHGSWLNAAEIELAILSTQCLDRRIPDAETLRAETTAWTQERDAACVTVNWHFTADARIKLASIYPT